VILHAYEDIDYKLIWNVVKTLVEIANATFRMLFEDLELRVLLVKLVCDSSADNVRQH